MKISTALVICAALFSVSCVASAIIESGAPAGPPDSFDLIELRRVPTGRVDSFVIDTGLTAQDCVTARGVLEAHENGAAVPARFQCIGRTESGS